MFTSSPGIETVSHCQSSTLSFSTDMCDLPEASNHPSGSSPMAGVVHSRESWGAGRGPHWQCYTQERGQQNGGSINIYEWDCISFIYLYIFMQSNIDISYIWKITEDKRIHKWRILRYAMFDDRKVDPAHLTWVDQWKHIQQPKIRQDQDSRLQQFAGEAPAEVILHLRLKQPVALSFL